MKKQLWLLRHAKSDWDQDLSDFERPLNKRGKKDAIQMGNWMMENKLVPDLIISSPAERAFQTCHYILQGFQGQINVPVWDKRLYLADVDTILSILKEQSENNHKIMIVGHNPGLDYLLQYLCGDKLPLTKKGKLMTTATLAIIKLHDSWSNIGPDENKLAQIARPKETFRK